MLKSARAHSVTLLDINSYLQARLLLAYCKEIGIGKGFTVVKAQADNRWRAGGVFDLVLYRAFQILRCRSTCCSVVGIGVYRCSARRFGQCSRYGRLSGEVSAGCVCLPRLRAGLPHYYSDGGKELQQYPRRRECSDQTSAGVICVSVLRLCPHASVWRAWQPPEHPCSCAE